MRCGGTFAVCVCSYLGSSFYSSSVGRASGGEGHMVFDARSSVDPVWLDTGSSALRPPPVPVSTFPARFYQRASGLSVASLSFHVLADILKVDEMHARHFA